MQIVYAQQPMPVEAGVGIFLAGPTPRDAETPSWRPQAVELLKKHNFTGNVFIPEAECGGFSGTYDHQIEWEWAGLEHATTIVFWVPRELKTMPAFTTNVEFGLHCQSGKSVLGYPEDAPKMRYLHALADKYDIPVFHTLEETLIHATK
jgi:hypothetical protein